MDMAESSDTSNKPANSSDAAIQRVLVKIDDAVKSKKFYEAHQMYRTLYFRYLRQQRYEETLQLLYDGALVMFYWGQQCSGVDLANLYVEVLVKSNTEPCEKIILNIVKLLELITKDTAEKDAFVNATIVWSAKGAHKRGHPLLHKHFAEVFWKEKNYTQAKTHFLHSQDGSGLAKMLIELHRLKGYSNEVDLFIAQVVLQCLCLRNTNTAIKAFECYTSQHPSIDKGPPYLLPLLNFIWFLLEAVQRRRMSWFNVLCDQYKISIGRDPTYSQYLARIGEIFFDISIPLQRRRPNFMGNLFRFLTGRVRDFDGALSDDDEGPSESEPNTSRENSSLASSIMDVEALD